MKIYLASAGDTGSLIKEWKKMNLFLAESGGCMKAYMNDSNFYRDAFILQSYFYADEFTERVLIPSAKDFLLDSGAFTPRQSVKGDIDWNEFIDHYAEFIVRNNVNKFFELDIDNLVGYPAVLDLRKRLEDATGKKPIPVWHPSRGTDDFIKICDEYPYVSLGGIVGAGKGTKAYKQYQQNFPWFIEQAHKRSAKIHGLGYTSLEGIRVHHFDSVDSTAWTTGNRFGYIYHFDGRTMKKVDVPKGRKLNTGKVVLHNFEEWKKFQRYAEQHL